jgi:hypothetical protein
MLKEENEKYIILSQDFKKRDAAMRWMLGEYTKHPPESIVASNFAEDPNTVIAYIILDKSKLKPTPPQEKKLIKII